MFTVKLHTANIIFSGICPLAQKEELALPSCLAKEIN